jgi:hypothetical protein
VDKLDYLDYGHGEDELIVNVMTLHKISCLGDREASVHNNLDLFERAVLELDFAKVKLRTNGMVAINDLVLVLLLLLMSKFRFFEQCLLSTKTIKRPVLFHIM